MNITVKNSKIKGEVIAPPSKSYAHRYIIASFLSKTPCVLKGVGESKDVFATLTALSSVGLDFKLLNGDAILNFKSQNAQPIINCYESGSTLRFLLPIISALGINAKFTGSERLLSRPIKELVDVLNLNGGNINGFNVLGKLTAGNYQISGEISSQFITGLLFALPILNGDSNIIIKGSLVSEDYINITLNVLKNFGIKIQKTPNGYFIKGNQEYVLPSSVVVEGDYSGSAFLLSLGAINGEVKVKNLNENSAQGDKYILNALQKFGAEVIRQENGYVVKRKNLNAITLDCENIPDIVQILSVVASFSNGKSVFKNVNRLQIKESDRILGIINNLKQAGITAEFNGKDLTIIGGTPKAGVFQGENDHRTVMSAVALALSVDGESKIIGAEAIQKSYPNFFEDIKTLGGEISGDI